jgi:hypothetical protein
MNQPSQYTCPRCGAPIQAGQPTCANCGLSLDPASIAAFQAQQTVRVSPQGSYPPGAPAPSLARPRNRKTLLLAVAGGALFLCVVCGAISQFSRGPAAFTPTPQLANAPTILADAGNSSATNTPAAPTDTAVSANVAPTLPIATNTSAAPTNTSVPPTLAPTREPPSPTAAASTGVGQVGKAQISGGTSLTVNKVTTASSVNEYLKPKAGNIYLVVDVTIANIDRDTAPYNPLYFKVKDMDGYEYSDSLLAPAPDLKSGDLTKGQKARGNVAFEVPKTAKGFVLTYEPLVIFGDFTPIQVDLGR